MNSDLIRIELDNILREERFSIHFQPIVDVANSKIFGYEALTRGPQDSALHSPIVLFEAAASEGRLVELERMVLRESLRRFRQLELPGQLFLNVTADTLVRADGNADLIHKQLEANRIPASRIVVELTETRPALDVERMSSSMATLRRMGFIVAIDDLGEGFASLRRWIDIRPNFVKIDRHFVDGIAGEPTKQQFLRSIIDMAASTGCVVVAEGIEQQSDLGVMRRLGVNICQGFLFARPSATPRSSLRADVVNMLVRDDRLSAPVLTSLSGGAIQTAGQLTRRGTTVQLDLTCERAVEMFRRDDSLNCLPVLDSADKPIGVLRSLQVLRLASERYFMDINARKSCTAMMDPHPLVFDSGVPLVSMSEAVANLDDRLMVDGFIVTRHGAYFGTGRTSDLLKALSDLQVSAARYANPLTLLPGNVPIDQHIDRLIGDGQRFAVAAWDIDNFKPFNDVYGYRTGDDVILVAAEALLRVASTDADFVGHIGGDDFILVSQSDEFKEKMERVCADFDVGVRKFFSEADLQAGGYRALNRQNEEVFTHLPTFSAGATYVLPGSVGGAHELSARLAELKRVVKARQTGRSRVFVDRRHSAAANTSFDSLT